MKRLCIGAIVLFVAFFRMSAEEIIPPDFDSYIAAVQEQFEAPGIAVAIVKDGKVVLAKGYGVQQNAPYGVVDSKTLFGIASNTKAFTAVALALLVEEGKIEWDAPVVRYLPWFQLSKSKVTQELTIRDLLTHRSGLGYGAGNLLLWPKTTYTRKEIVCRLRYVPLATEPRSAYGYSNMLYVAAGELIEAVSGLSWEDFITTRIFKKVGMSNSTINGGTNETKALNDNPAGGINSCAEDMAKWMICLLDSGRIGGITHLYTPSTSRELWTAVPSILSDTADPELSPPYPTFKGYALGFRVFDYRGKKLIGHTGALNGYVSRIAMIPEMKLGVAVFVNARSSEVYHSIINKTLDYYLDALEFDWIGLYRNAKARTDSINSAEEQKVTTSRLRASHPTLKLTKYIHTYRDSWYGDIMVSMWKNKLRIRFMHSPSLIGILEHYQKDTFIARWKYLGRHSDAYVKFVLNTKGEVDHVTMKAIMPSTNRSLDFHNLLLRPIGQ